MRIFQVGRVIIGDQVDIGSNCAIDRGALGDTVIGAMSALDNLVQIGHNVNIGKGCVLAGQAGVAGSTTLGDYVMVGGAVSISDHLTIGNGAKIAGKSGVMRDVARGRNRGGLSRRAGAAMAPPDRRAGEDWSHASAARTNAAFGAVISNSVWRSSPIRPGGGDNSCGAPFTESRISRNSAWARCSLAQLFQQQGKTAARLLAGIARHHILILAHRRVILALERQGAGIIQFASASKAAGSTCFNLQEQALPPPRRRRTASGRAPSP